MGLRSVVIGRHKPKQGPKGTMETQRALSN